LDEGTRPFRDVVVLVSLFLNYVFTLISVFGPNAVTQISVEGVQIFIFSYGWPCAQDSRLFALDLFCLEPEIQVKLDRILPITLGGTFEPELGSNEPQTFEPFQVQNYPF
jgi:hypothetical protein